MAKKQTSWKTRGMNRDLSVSAFSPEFAFENMNLRLATNDSNTLMSWVNERGTASIRLTNVEYWSKNGKIVYQNPNNSSWTHHAAEAETITIAGTPIGTAVINHQLVIFSKGTSDLIYVLKYADGDKTYMLCKKLFEGNLNFSTDYPLETLVSYEAENIQKIYWTDGLNPPRLINIEGKIIDGNNTQFDFVPELQLNEYVMVEKLLGANGMFAPGVIQYAFTYYRKNGQESNIFYTSPLQYISYKERGASPEDKVENAFKITVGNLDLNFDYLRIYSIQRTSVDATPIAKRLRDIPLEDIVSTDTVSFIDTGTTGDSIDPTELLYKGGESIVAQTIEQKDNTLFLGNLTINRPMLDSSLTDGSRDTSIKENTKLYDATRTILPQHVSSGSYPYYNQLTSKAAEDRHYGSTVPCGGFKTGDWYRCGVQFQYKTGKWSNPVWIKDKQVESKSSDGIDSNDNLYKVVLPIIKGELNESMATTLWNAGYRKVRPVVVFPSMLDRDTICQGVVCPTMYTKNHRISDKDLYAQASWFFRPYRTSDEWDTVQNPNLTIMYPKSKDGEDLRYTDRSITFEPKYLRQVEIEGHFNADDSTEEVNGNRFKVDRKYRTLHSPDVEFDEQLLLVDFLNVSYQKVGNVEFLNTLSDIDIQTETPGVSSAGSGFVHHSFTDIKSSGNEGAKGIVAGLFYEDFVVDDDVKDTGAVGAYPYIIASPKWLIYPWQGSGSLNNDINRPTDKGTQTAILKKKVISNLRYADTTLKDWASRDTFNTCSVPPQIFSSNENTIIKIGNDIYKGNIDTSIVPDEADGSYFCFDGWERTFETNLGLPMYNDNVGVDKPTPFYSSAWCKTFSKSTTEADQQGLYKWQDGNVPPGYERFKNQWLKQTGNDIGDTYVDLAIKKHPVRMKYKSTPHLVLGAYSPSENQNNTLDIVEIKRTTDGNTRYGGTTADALRENVWIPCGEPVSLNNIATVNPGTPEEYQAVPFYYDYGDTYFQRYDCLKTYAFTREDPNQIVEIGSFMLESRINIDGRYDRNRGQANNLNMSPQNFNLLNPIYSQKDNFFSYNIQSDDYGENAYYPNQITWSKTKTSGADVDMWTNMTLASMLELDGNKGQITSLQRFNDLLICFQDTGISQILYNENVQISSTAGVPIEIANSDKVQGKRYYTDTIGCSNKWSIVPTTAGIYFIDSNDKSIYNFSNQIQNVSQQGNFNSWCKQNIPSQEKKWTPTGFDTFTAFYDRKNQEVLFVNAETALAFSEKMGAFTSFYNYENTPFFCNLDDTGIWIKGNQLWKHQAGNEYCTFFGEKKPYWMTLVGNPEPQMDKIFTNLEFRACVDGEGDFDQQTEKFTPSLPFNSLETWNEYQHGITTLSNRNGHSASIHHSGSDSSLKRKFRIWRCDIPRDNAALALDADKNITRFKVRPQDRMRNPWLYLKLMKNANNSNYRTEIHDLIMTYFG